MFSIMVTDSPCARGSKVEKNREVDAGKQESRFLLFIKYHSPSQTKLSIANFRRNDLW